MGNDLNTYASPFNKPVISVHAADFGSILIIIFFIVFVTWAIYTAVAAYHWLRYGHQSWLAIPAIVVHVIVSGLCILLMASGA